MCRAAWWLSSNRRPFRGWVTSADSLSNCRIWAAIRCRIWTAWPTRSSERAVKDNKLVGLYTSYTASDPQLLITIDREKAKALGVSLSQISSALSVYMGSAYINDFNYNNRSYRVYVQARQSARMTPGICESSMCVPTPGKWSRSTTW